MIKVQVAEDVVVPKDLEQRVRNYLKENPEEPWAAGVLLIAEEIASTPKSRKKRAP
jgi:hypothetical protein